MQTQTAGVDMPSKEAMTRLAKAAERLNRLSDRLNESLETFEDHLGKLGIGIVYWYGGGETNIEEYLVDADDRAETLLEDGRTTVDGILGWLLGYTKIDGQWRVAAKRVHLIEDRENFGGYTLYRSHPPIPLVKAPRSVRLKAARELEGLVLALSTQLENYGDTIESAHVFLEKQSDSAQ